MNSKYEVKITRQAMEQMKGIKDYISEELLVPEIANHLLEEIKDSILSLAVLPKRHTLVDEEPWKSEKIRKIIVKNFLIYYWVDDENYGVYVIAVIYNKRDQIRQFLKGYSLEI